MLIYRKSQEIVSYSTLHLQNSLCLANAVNYFVNMAIRTAFGMLMYKYLDPYLSSMFAYLKRKKHCKHDGLDHYEYLNTKLHHSCIPLKSSSNVVSPIFIIPGISLVIYSTKKNLFSCYLRVQHVTTTM